MPVTDDLEVDKAASHIRWAGSAIAVHSHHYHFQLQNTLDLTDFIDGGELTRKTAKWAMQSLFTARFAGKKPAPKEVLTFASELFHTMGFGTLSLPDGEQSNAPTNMYADGWTAAHGYRGEKRTKCNFPAGYIAGALSAAYNTNFEVTETQCKAQGAPRCVFVAKDMGGASAPAAYETRPSMVAGPAPAAAPASGAAFTHNIDEAGIMNAVLGLPLMGDDKFGLVEKFGVLVNWTPQQFYSGLEYNFINQLAGYDLGLERSAEELLHFDGEACALNTLHGITRSAEWAGLVKPQLSKSGDAVVALNAIMNCLGWGKCQIIDLNPGEGVTVKLFGGQEGLGYRTMFGISKKPRCYAFSGAVRALMEVFLPGEVVEAKFGRFRVEEKQCIAMGHPHCEFVATRST